MNGPARNGQLPDRRRLVVDTVTRQVSHLVAEVSALVRATTALRHRPEAGLSVVSVGRVCAAPEPSVEPTGQVAAVLWPLRRQTLPAGCRPSLGYQGAGDGGHLFSKGQIDG